MPDLRRNRALYWGALMVARIYTKTPDGGDRYRNPIYFSAMPIPAPAALRDLDGKKARGGPSTSWYLSSAESLLTWTALRGDEPRQEEIGYTRNTSIY